MSHINDGNKNIATTPSGKKGGYIINLSSTSGIRGMPTFEYYSASKFALEGMMDSLRYSLFGYGISITNVNAGPVRTDFVKNMRNKGGSGSRFREVIDSTGYLKYITERMSAFLNTRINGG